MLNLNKSNFKSRIGMVYYIWTQKDSNLPTLIYLGISEKSFLDYLHRLGAGYNNIIFSENRSDYIEERIIAYFNKKKDSLNLPYMFLTGNDFEKKIWAKTACIPYGHVCSYKEIAENAGCTGAWRAAGTALGNNPIMLVIPCHRIIKSSGEIGRFGGGEKVKEFLLKHEAG